MSSSWLVEVTISHLLLLRRDTKTSRDTPPLWFFDLLFAKIYEGNRDAFFKFLNYESCDSNCKFYFN